MDARPLGLSVLKARQTMNSPAWSFVIAIRLGNAALCQAREWHVSDTPPRVVSGTLVRINDQGFISIRDAKGELAEISTAGLTTADRNYVDAYTATLLVERTARSQVASKVSDEARTKNATIPRKAAPTKSLVASARTVTLRPPAETISTVPPTPDRTSGGRHAVPQANLQRAQRHVPSSWRDRHWRYDFSGHRRHSWRRSCASTGAHTGSTTVRTISTARSTAFADWEPWWCDGVPIYYRTPANARLGAL